MPSPQANETVSGRLERVARAFASKNNLPLQHAYMEVGRMYPDDVLAARYEVLGYNQRSKQVGDYKMLIPDNAPHPKVSWTLSELAKCRAFEKKITLGEALRQIGRENPDLVHQARAETLGIKL